MPSRAEVAYELLINLAPISETSLDEGAECIICKVPFGTQPFEGCRLEHPTRLTCPGSHIVGSECIKDWLSPGRLSHNSCPYCRHELFPHCEPLVAATTNINEPENNLDSDESSSTEQQTALEDMFNTMGWQDPNALQLELESGEPLPPDHPIRTLRQREIQLYKRLASEGIEDLPSLDPSPLGSDSPWGPWGVYTIIHEYTLFSVLAVVGAFDDGVLPECHRGFPGTEAFDGSEVVSIELWKRLKREGLCWDLGPVAGEVGRGKGWYLD